MIAIAFDKTNFLQSCPLYSQLPRDDKAEIAIAGRSNAGKSTLINELCQQKGLAKTSGMPGKTREMNLFALYNQGDSADESLVRLVDLPGYGYAKANFTLQKQWQQELTSYLVERENLQLLLVVMDARHPLRDSDQLTITMAAKRNLRQILIFNKVDKLNQSEKSKLKKVMQEASEIWPNVVVIAHSSTKKIGHKELKQLINNELSYLANQQLDE